MKKAQQVVTHQPARSFSISFQDLFNRAGGRTSNVVQEMKEHSTKHIVQSRFSIGLIKCLAIIAFILLPFSFSSGVADWRYLTVAAIAGLIWCGTLVYSWRCESILASGLAFLIAMGAFHISKTFYTDEPPFGHFLQWLAVLLAVVASPLFIFRSRLLDFCRLQQTDAQQVGTSNGG